MEGRAEGFNFGVVTGAMIEMISNLILIRCNWQPLEGFEHRSDMN